MYAFLGCIVLIPLVFPLRTSRVDVFFPRVLAASLLYLCRAPLLGLPKEPVRRMTYAMLLTKVVCLQEIVCSPRFCLV